MSVIKYVNAVAVGFLLYSIYVFLSTMSVVVYPKLGISGYELKAIDQNEYGFIYQKVEFCLKEDKLDKREACVKDLDKKRSDKYISGLLETSRFNAVKDLINSILSLIVIIAYFVFFRKFISVGEYSKSSKYDGRKPSYKRVIRK